MMNKDAQSQCIRCVSSTRYQEWHGSVYVHIYVETSEHGKQVIGQLTGTAERTFYILYGTYVLHNTYYQLIHVYVHIVFLGQQQHILHGKTTWRS